MPKKESLLEEDLEQEYMAWKSNPSPQTLAPLLDKLKPTMSAAATAIGGDSPVLVSRAKQIIISVLPKYDPRKAPLRGFLAQHLRGLNRFAQKQSTIISVPERVAMERAYLNDVEISLTNELGRPPTDAEIADETGLSLKRLKYVRTYSPAAAEGSFESDPAVEAPGFDENIIVQLVYDELSPYHQKVMEHTLGLNGRPVLSVTQLAAMLKRSPGAISQARAVIQAKLDAMRRGLQGL